MIPPDRWSTLAGALYRVLAAATIVLVVLGLAAMTRGETKVERLGQGAEIVLLLDRSRSMDQSFYTETRVEDLRPTLASPTRESKTSVARRLLSQFIAKRPDDLFGMVIFSTLPIQVLDFTQKQEVIQAAIAASAVGKGIGDTDLGLGLERALSLFDGRPYTGSRIILLVSDGGAHLDVATRERLARLVKQHRVSLYWIYIRSFRSPGLLADKDVDAQTADTVPEHFLHKYFSGIGTPYRRLRGREHRGAAEGDRRREPARASADPLHRSAAAARPLAAVLRGCASVRARAARDEVRGGAPMGVTRKRRRELWLGVAAAVLIALLAFDLRQLVQLRDWNRAIADGAVTGFRGQLPAPLLFAQAYHQPPGSDYQAVLALYKRAEVAGDPALQAMARYNSGNVYFREGLAMRDADNEQQAVPLLELAKGAYRQTLKQDPSNWDARYNLERVLRQRPEPEDLDDGGLGAPQQAERAATTMRGFSLGLP